MGKYNPHAPEILGQEWAPIRYEPYSLDNEVERGHTFQLDVTTTVVSGGVYIEEVPPNVSMKSVGMAVYRTGEEHLTGPIKRVVIPVSAAVGSGTGTVSFTGPSLVAALQSPNDNRYVLMYGSAELDLSFDVNAFSTQLSGKRIVGVNFLYTVAGGTPDNATTFLTPEIHSIPPDTDMQYPTPTVTSVDIFNISSTGRLSLGDTNLWTTTQSSDASKFPYRYQDLQRFASGATNALTLMWDTAGFAGTENSDLIYIPYTAMEVLYCEETRLLYGAKTSFINTNAPLALGEGANTVQLRPSDTFAATGKVLTPGEYTVTTTLSDMGPYIGAGGGYKTRALRQLYQIPTHRGVELTRAIVENRVFTQREIDILPQLSLHTVSSVVTGVHVYGEQIAAPVYDGVDATQEIVQLSGGAAVEYPQVRFYARRFGDTDVSLSFFRTAGPTQVVTITPAEFDALPEIVDGWREVTLRFTVIPTFSNAGTISGWTWRATGLAVGSQWQILAADAPSVTTPTALNVDAATYGNTAADLTGDSSADAVVLFSQDPPAVTGLAVEGETQELEVVDGECGVAPDCVPTGIDYNRVTWQALVTTSFETSGFGYYELQRQDDVDTEWNTVMKTTSIAVTGFSDYEARVGVESRYRIRSANVYEFLGAWSAQVARTLTAPGVTGIGNGNSVLIFTTNERQDGSGNLAYSMIWPRDISEDFTFAEASNVQLRELYRRDFAIAFRPTERGGERFSRDILVQNAAVSTGRVRDGFVSLRDMAWDDVSYVCVRNELGDRWLATVVVPSGTIRRNRRLYVARIDIIETTDVPSEVDPA